MQVFPLRWRQSRNILAALGRCRAVVGLVMLPADFEVVVVVVVVVVVRRRSKENACLVVDVQEEVNTFKRHRVWALRA